MDAKMRVIVFIVIGLAVTFPGCRTTGTVNTALVEHSAAVERSQNAQRELIGIIDRAEARLDFIESTAGSLSDNLDRIGELFTEYDSIVRELVNGIKSVQGTLGAGETDRADITHNGVNNNPR